jgi:hypothetical protein
MADRHETTTARCACGRVAYEITGAPILMAICHCDDCQAAGGEIEALPGARPVLDQWAGTPYALVRRDRIRCVAGEDLLVARKRRSGSLTSRMVASCCNSAMLVRFDSGPHWVSVYASAIEPPPAMEMRVQTKFKPADVVLPGDVPAYPFAPLRFVAKLVAARIAMLLPG